MKASEKLDVYNLLKTASAQILGYNSVEFSGNVPDFTDDPENIQVEEKVKAKGVTLESIAQKISACQNCIFGFYKHDIF